MGWWGHHTGWKLPKFSELNGHVKEKDDWCGEHNVTALRDSLFLVSGRPVFALLLGLLEEFVNRGVRP